MIKNYFKTAFRNLWKTRGYSFLNIAGLAIGIACAGLIFLWVEDELNYNSYFTNSKNIYKIKDRQTYDGTTFVFDATPGLLAQGIKAEIPGIKNTARTTWGDNGLFALNDKSIYESGLFVDSSFFSIFHLQFIKGNPANIFTNLYSLVITETMANKFFGSTDVVGKSLKVDNDKSFIITGVVEDLPENASFYKNHWFAPFKIYEDKNTWLQQWGNNGVVTYVETQPNANIAAINKMLYGYIQTKAKGASAHMSIYSMSRWRLYDSYDKNGAEKKGRIKFVNLFGTIAWIILLIACINFMNLATARSEQRAREVGVRKVMGAGKQKLILQFIGESLFMAVISALLAVGLIYLTLPSFNGLVEKHLSVHLFEPGHLLALAAIAVVCGLIAGSYPAFYLSSFNPITVIKGLKLKRGASAGFIRKGLVVTQFTISIILIISTILIYQQIQHAKDRELGYNKNDLVFMETQGKMVDNFNVIKNDLVNTGLVQNAALSSQNVLQYGSNSGDFGWQGKDPGKQLLVSIDYVSPEFISAAGMHLKEGRDFYPNASADSNNIIINETLAKEMKMKNVIGSIITRGSGEQFTVVGVVHDFIYNNMYSAPAPLIIFCYPPYTNFLSVRFKPNTNLQTGIAKLESTIKKDNPGYPVEYKFVDEEFDQYFKTETLIGKLAGVFAILAIVISCLGLFGLAAYTAERRTKEIGIRKVLGASARGMASLLSKDFLQLVTISCIIAFPVAWWIMHSWLQDYEYRVKISWWIFLAAGLLAIVIALATVSFQAIKAAMANPVESLRTE